MRGKLVSLVTTKGGSGKSTLALTLAHARTFQSTKVCIVEADPQGSLETWAKEREGAGRPNGVPVFARHKVNDLLNSDYGIAAGLEKIIKGTILPSWTRRGKARPTFARCSPCRIRMWC